MPSAAPKPKVVPLRGLAEIPSSGGRHSGPEFRETFGYGVELGGAVIAQFDAKPQAQAFIDGWEKHRTYTKELIDIALGVAP